MTATQSLEMKKYYPEWKDILGTEVFNGFRFDYEGTLLEVVTPHILSEEKKSFTTTYDAQYHSI